MSDSTWSGNQTVWRAQRERVAAVTRMALVVAGVVAALLNAGCDVVAQSEGLDSERSDSSETSQASAEPDVRGLVVNTGRAAPGLVMFTPLLSDTTYLVDAAGLVVHTWDSGMSPGGGSYLLDNGHLLRLARDPEITSFRAGGVGGLIQELDWDGEVVWQWGLESEDRVLHHDLEPLPNGNVLALGWEVKGTDAARAAGRRADLMPDNGLWPDFVIEVEKLPPNGANIVWEWHVWDHLVQDVDPTGASYGVPAEHPGRLDVNGDGERELIDDEQLEQLKAIGYVPADAKKEDLDSDFLHVNAVEYNAALDQIALSVPELGEIWILDHGTTTTEAAGSKGGRYGRGGDLLYRWGNPATYGRGDEADQRLFYQHDVRWIPDGFPGAGHLTIFNNGGGRPEGDWSSVLEIALPANPDGSYRLETAKAFGPDRATWIYEAADRASFFAPFISGAHRLANGNTMICSGPDGRFLEVDAEGTIVWEYRNPFSGEVRLADGTLPQPGLDKRPFAAFRATKIPSDHPALIGRDLRPLDPQPEAWSAPPEEES